MAEPLPNRSEELPDRKYYDPDSSENWADPLEAVIEEVSANSIVSGPDRTAFDPLDGQLYIPTDGGDWYLGNGSTWDALGMSGDLSDHINDTTNPHSVTADQVGSPSDAEFTSHTGDTTNPHSVTAAQTDALPTSGGTVTGDTTFGNIVADESRAASETIRITVPGDFASIQAALDEIREIRTPPGVRYEVMVQSDHTITEPIRVSEEDLLHVTLLSEDTTVPVGGTFPNEHVFEIYRSIGPLFRMKIDAQGNGLFGIQVTGGSVYHGGGTLNVGVINAGTIGLNVVNVSAAFAYRNDFSGAGEMGAKISRASQATFGRGGDGGPADLSGAGQFGLRAERGSIVRAEDIDCSGAGVDGIRAETGAVIAALGATATGCGTTGVRATQGGIVDVENGSIDNSSGNGVNAYDGGTINATNATITNASGRSIRAAGTGRVAAAGADCSSPSGTEVGVYAVDLGQIDFNGGTIDGSPGHGLSANNGGRISARGATATNSTNNDINAANGSVISANECTTTNSTGGNPHTSDVSHTGMDTVAGIIFGDFEA